MELTLGNPTAMASKPSPLQLAVQKYEELFPAFSDSRECKLTKVGGQCLHRAQARWGPRVGG